MRNDSPAKSGGGRGKKGPVAGRIVAAGAHTRERMAFLLGIDEAGPEYAVASAAWLDHAIEIGVSGEGETLVVFRIERRGPESQGLLVTEHLNVYSRGPKMPPKLAEVVHRRARERFGDWDMERFSKLVEEDPEAGKPGLAMPPQPDEEERPSSLLDTWGADDSYADFFAGGEMARSQLDSIDPSKVFHFVQHCDNECLFVNPHSVGSVVSLINFPWDDRVRQPAKPLEQAMGNLADREFIAEGMITTDLDEDDVIRGNPDKLRSLLRYAASRPNSDDKLLFISNTCVPSVIGEDVQSVTEEVQEETGREMLYLTVTPRSMVNVFHQLLVERRKRAEESMGPPAPDSLNLIGFAGDRCRAEMREALEALGLQVGTWLFPELTPQLIESLPAASLNVFYPNKLWQHLYDQLVEGSRVPHISAPAPFGFEATRTWLEQILEAQGKSEALEPFWSAYAAEH
ncbi:MAG: nitrogenase component 1, partial [Myxococcales bacterium]|nr:nitrogenase component 1 [Myxococcales bacterium]